MLEELMEHSSYWLGRRGWLIFISIWSIRILNLLFDKVWSFWRELLLEEEFLVIGFSELLIVQE